MEMNYDGEDTRWLDKSSEQVYMYGDSSAGNYIQAWVRGEGKSKWKQERVTTVYAEVNEIFTRVCEQ